MENVEHLWNITQFLMKNNNPQVNELRNYYVRCCKELSDEVELPKHIFGPNTMCSHCGSLWTTVNRETRISKGRGLSNTIQKLVKVSSKNSSNLTKYQKKLMQRCIKKRDNKLIITCSYCKKQNKIILNKPERLKNKKNDKPEITPRKKKKRKDKTAGLIINTPNAVNESQNNEYKNSHNSDNKLEQLHMKKGKRRKSNTSTPNNKSKKIDISKLKGMINTTYTPSKKINLHSFLSELG